MRLLRTCRGILYSKRGGPINSQPTSPTLVNSAGKLCVAQTTLSDGTERKALYAFCLLVVCATARAGYALRRAASKEDLRLYLVTRSER
jgi:hypothetical protein